LGIDLFCGCGGFRAGLLEVAVARKSVVVRKRVEAEKVRIGIGLANVLSQSETVVRAFGPRLGFVLMLVAILAGAAVTGGAAVLVTRTIGRYLLYL
jgi:hypothetical protein